MKLWQRIALAVGIFVVDLAVFFVPLSAVFLMVVILARPDWVKKFVDKLYKVS